MIQYLDAIYKNGSFCPVNDAPITLSDGERVRLTVEPLPQDLKKNVLDLAAKVYAGLSDEDVTDIEKIALDRTNFFSR